MIRAAILALVLAPTLALAQAGEDEPGKVSNDQPDRPLQMPPAAGEAKEAFDDFERFSRRGAWERAAKALYAIPEAQAGRFVDGPEGFIIPVARKRREVLAGLAPEGQAAYRLFYDAEAKKLLDQADGPAEQATLERVVSAYFLTTVGDRAADRLGDLYFEQGRFDRAADCWLAVLRERPDTGLSPALMAVKSALALARAGRRSEIEAIRRDLAGRYADEVVTLGGRSAKAAEHLRRALGDDGRPRGSSAAEANAGPPPGLADPVAPAWQVKFGASVMAGMTPPEATQWASNALSGAVPPVAIEGGTLYANYLGHVFAVDLASGKMRWRSSSFHNVELAAMQDHARTVDAARFGIVAAPGYVLSLSRDLKDVNFQAPFRLACRRAEGGDVAWQSADLPEYAEVDPIGQPILGGGALFLAAKTAAARNQNQAPAHLYLLAIRPHDGKVLRKTELGTFRQTQQYYFYGMGDTSPQPRLAYRSGSVYVDTHAGVLARLDAESGELDWGYGYPTDPVQGMGGFIFFGSRQNQGSAAAGGAPLDAGDALLVKGVKSGKVCAIDPDRMKALWDRPIAKSARLLGSDERALYLGGPELGALDRRTRALLWSTPLPAGSEEGRVLVRPDGLWQLTPRGIFELDPRTGRVRRIFRGDDAGASGGDLILTARWLLAVSNRAISAYPRGSAAAAAGSTADRGEAASQARGTE